MLKKKEVKQLLDGAEMFIIATDKGVGIVGSDAEICSALTSIIKEIRDNAPRIDDEMIEKCYELSKMDGQELVAELLKNLKQMLEKIDKKNKKQ